jgi:hypothetical protein
MVKVNPPSRPLVLRRKATIVPPHLALRNRKKEAASFGEIVLGSIQLFAKATQRLAFLGVFVYSAVYGFQFYEIYQKSTFKNRGLASVAAVANPNKEQPKPGFRFTASPEPKTQAVVLAPDPVQIEFAPAEPIPDPALLEQYAEDVVLPYGTQEMNPNLSPADMMPPALADQFIPPPPGEEYPQEFYAPPMNPGYAMPPTATAEGDFEQGEMINPEYFEGDYAPDPQEILQN